MAPTVGGVYRRRIDQQPGTDLDLVIVGGAGRAGLPLGLAFAAARLRVGLYDVDGVRLESIARGVMPFREVGADDALREALCAGRLTTSMDAAILERAENLVVVIATPLDELHNPSFAVFDAVIDDLAAHARPRGLIVLRSTVYPGTTAHVASALAARGVDVDLAFCPERIMEGNALAEIRSLPQIVGADGDRAGDRAERLFRVLVEHVIRTTAKEAELAKLLTNAWRYMKFAIGNQFFMISTEAGVNHTQVLRAIREEYPRAADLPGPGFAAGPCLLKDTVQLAAFTSDHFPLAQAAIQVNEGLPAFVLEAVESAYGQIRGRTVGILGMAFKGDSDDPRSSLSYKLRKLLAWRGARVLCTDPYVADERLVPLDHVLADADLLIIAAPHSDYARLDLAGRVVVDVWGSRPAGIRI